MQNLSQNIGTTQGRPHFHPVISSLFDKKGFTQEDIEEFLSWDLLKLPLMSSLKDLDKTAQRIIVAIKNNEPIAIYGDYDVDGTTSCALFYQFFKLLGTQVTLIQPSRFVEGYGIHPPSILKAREDGIKLMITVDCGITAKEACDTALEVGVDLIITDHHTDALDEMPPAYSIVNPNRRDEPKDSPLVSMAGVAVAFAVCVEVKKLLEATQTKKLPTLYPLLQYVAIGTICDLAKLNSMNLKFVRHGLKQIQKTTYPGIRAFFDNEERKRSFVPSEKLSFDIGPKINSKGRLDHPEVALKLLICTDSQDAFHYYSQLDSCNQERKIIQSEVFKAANEQVLKVADEDHLISIVYGEEWHEGVIGIVASRLVETYKVPAIVFSDSEEDGVIKASARSAGTLDLFTCLKDHSHLFLKFGGHKAAAGLSMKKENLEEFKKSVKTYLKDIPAIIRTQNETYDLEITPEQITPQLLKELDMLEPFGMGNKKPVFKMSDFYLKSYDLLKDVHVRWNLTHKTNPRINLKGISFNYIGKWGLTHPEDIFQAQKNPETKLEAFFTLGINHFNGNKYIQLMIDKIVKI